MMVICPDCGKDVKEAKFCSNCGALLPKVDEVEDKKVNISIEEEVDEPVSDVVVDDASVVDEPVSDVVVDGPDDEPVSGELVVGSSVSDEEPVEEPVESNDNKKTKFCSNCGTEVNLETVFCPQCGFRLIKEETQQTKFCQSCGKKIDINAEICPHCGVRVANFNTPSEEKSALLAAILSFLFPGLGHIYLGLTKKGISFIIAYIVSAVLIFLVIGFVLIFIVWLWALIDSIKSTEAINKGEFVEDKLF